MLMFYTRSCLPQLKVSCILDSNSKVNSSCSNTSKALSNTRQKVVSSKQIAKLQTEDHWCRRKSVVAGMGPWGNPVLIKHPCKDFPPTAVCYSEIMKRGWKTWKFYHTWVCEEDKYAIFCYRFLIYKVLESWRKPTRGNQQDHYVQAPQKHDWQKKKKQTCCMGIFTFHNVHPTLKISAKKTNLPWNEQLTHHLTNF